MATNRKPPDRIGNVRGAPEKNIDLVSPERSSAPHMPHERDEAVGSTGGLPSERVRQGQRDLKRGLQDTSRAPEAGRAYERQKK
jgi:hypothetical protein